MTEKIYYSNFSNNNNNNYYGATISKIGKTVQGSIEPLSFVVIEFTNISKTGLINRINYVNCNNCNVEIYEDENLNKIIYGEVVEDANEQLTADKVISYISENNSLYVKITNLSETITLSSSAIELYISRFFEVNPLRNHIQSGTITYPTNKIYNLMVCDTVHRLSVVHTKTKIGSCGLRILNNGSISYQFSANTNLNKYELVSGENNIFFSKDSLISLEVYNSNIVEDLFFNIVFERL